MYKLPKIFSCGLYFILILFFVLQTEAACTATTCSDCVKDINCAWCVLTNPNATSSSTVCVDGTYKGENNEGLCQDFFWLQCTIPGQTFKTRYTYLILFLLCLVVFIAIVVGIIVVAVYQCKQRRSGGGGRKKKKERTEQSDMPGEHTELASYRNKFDNESIASLGKRSASVARRSASVSTEQAPKGVEGKSPVDDKKIEEAPRTQKRDESSNTTLFDLVNQISSQEVKPPTPPMPRAKSRDDTISESSSTHSSTSDSTKPPTPPSSYYPANNNNRKTSSALDNIPAYRPPDLDPETENSHGVEKPAVYHPPAVDLLTSESSAQENSTLEPVHPLVSTTQPTNPAPPKPQPNQGGLPQLDLTELDEIEKTLDDMMKKY